MCKDFSADGTAGQRSAAPCVVNSPLARGYSLSFLPFNVTDEPEQCRHPKQIQAILDQFLSNPTTVSLRDGEPAFTLDQ